MNELNKVFVYGTLKVGGVFSKYVEDELTSAIGATIEGTMFNVHDSYPAVIFKGKTKLVGELQEFNDITQVLKICDRIEGFRGEGSQVNLYNRVKVIVTTENDEEVECYAYEFNRSPDTLKKVHSGIWEI